jgi:hypothetical protein
VAGEDFVPDVDPDEDDDDPLLEPESDLLAELDDPESDFDEGPDASDELDELEDFADVPLPSPDRESVR